MNSISKANEPVARRRIVVACAVAVSMTAVLGACSTPSFLSSKSQGTTSSGSVPFTDRISSLFGGGSQTQTPATPTSEDFDCPRIDIRQGASTLLINAAGNDPNALGLRYQGTFVRAARECRVVGTNVNIKIGVQGRVILGPAGGAGSLTIPLRYALVYETLNQSKPIWSKLSLIPVTIPPQTPTVDFTSINEDLTIPIPSAAELSDWVIYIGFDPAGAEQEQKRRPAKPARPPAKRAQQ